MKKKTTILLLAGSLMIAGIAALLYQSQNSRNQIRHYTAFFSTTGEEITSDNDMKKKIAEQIGADCEETWLKGQTKDNALNAINEQISNFAQTYPTNLKASSNEALLFMRRYRFANCSCFSCCFKDAYPSSNVQ